MKRSILLAALGAALISALAIGCADIDSGDSSPTVVSQADYMSSGKRSVTVMAQSEGGVLSFASKGGEARTILPESIAARGYDYYIAYVGSDNNPLVEKIDLTASKTDSSKGEAQKEFGVDTYTMELYALDADTTNGLSGAMTPLGTAPAGGATGVTYYDKDSVKGAAVLYGYTRADLRFVNAVSFYLTPNGLSGEGAYDIKIESAAGFYVDGSLFSVTCGLYDCDTNALVQPSPAQSITIDAATNAFDSATKLTSIGATPATIPTGAYNLEVMFTGKTGGRYAGKTFVYSERVIIVANRVSKGTVVVPDIIAQPPTAPVDFIAAYTAPASKTSNVYEVEFAWTDTSYRERGFEIDLMKVDDADPATPTYPVLAAAATGDGHGAAPGATANDSDTVWNGQVTAYVKGTGTKFDSASYTTDALELAGVDAWNTDINSVEYLTLTAKNLSAWSAFLHNGNAQAAGSANIIGGSLFMNSNHVRVQLPLDHRYTARIRAVNDAGASEYVYLTLPQPVAGKTAIETAGCSAGTNGAQVTTAAYTVSGTPFHENVNALNLFRITYEVGEGAFKEVATPKDLTKGTDVLLTQYKSQRAKVTGTGASIAGDEADDADAVAILTPNSRTAAFINKAIQNATGTLGSINAADEYASNGDDATGNAANATGGTPGPIKIELAKGDNNWQFWEVDCEGGAKYTMKAVASTYPTSKGDPTLTSPTEEPEPYKGCKSLVLFANYSPKTTVGMGVQTEDMTRYELKDNFIDVTLTDKSSATATGTILAKSGTSLTGAATFADFMASDNVTGNGGKLIMSLVNDACKIAVNLNANVKYTDAVTSADVAFNYDRLELEVVKVAGSASVCKKSVANPKTTDSLVCDLTKYSGNMVYVCVRAWKGSYCYEKRYTLDLVE